MQMTFLGPQCSVAVVFTFFFVLVTDGKKAALQLIAADHCAEETLIHVAWNKS